MSLKNMPGKADKYICNRIAASAFMLFTLSSQMIACSARMKTAVVYHKELEPYQKLTLRYFTNWNVLLQIFYAVVSLVCDLTTFFEQHSLIPEKFRKLRCTVFCSLVFPLSSAVLSFWLYYFYDRDLLFPEVLDLVVTFSQNVTIHFGVFLYALWELAYLPKESIKREARSKWLMFGVGATYICALYYTKYVDLGIWCYNVMTVYEDSVLFYFPIVFPLTLAVIAYNIQWCIKDYIWRHRDLSLKA